MAAKIRIKVGPVEFEYEGETELTLENIKEVFGHVEALSKVSPAPAGGHGQAAPADAPAANGAGAPLTPPGQKLHVNSIATKLAAKTGPDLALAAAASLQVFDQKETFTRSELLDTMKKAKMHFKDSMSGNLTRILATLVGSKFNQVNDGVYSLNADAFQDLAKQLA